MVRIFIFIKESVSRELWRNFHNNFIILYLFTYVIRSMKSRIMVCRAVLHGLGCEESIQNFDLETCKEGRDHVGKLGLD